MENRNDTITMEQFESDFKALLENKDNNYKRNDEENEIDSDCITLANQLKCSIIEEITNDSAQSSNCVSSSSPKEQEKHLEIASLLDNVKIESMVNENGFNSRESQKYSEKYLGYEKDEVKIIRKGIINVSNTVGNSLVFLVRGKDSGYRVWVWRYIFVNSNEKDIFLRQIDTGSIYVQYYGTVFCSGWGENPPQRQIDKIKSFDDDMDRKLFIHKEISKNICIYHYAFIDSKKQKAFKELCNEGSISIEKIEKYGRILYTGYDTDSPEVVYRKMEEEYFCGNHFNHFFNFLNIFKNKNIESLHAAIQINDLELTVSYIKQGFNLNEGGKNDWTSLHHGAYTGNLQIVKNLLENGADLNAIDSVCGRKPVHIAAKEGHLDIIKLLLSSGNTVDDVDKNNWTLLHYAAWNGNLDIVKFLLDEGANASVIDNFSDKKPVHIAAREGHTEIVKLFLNSGIDIEDAGREGRTCLYYAAWFGRLDTAQFLIDKSANINTETKFSKRCIHVAARCGDIDMVRLFVNNGTDIDIPNKYGYTPLHHAVVYGDVDVVIFLINGGARVNIISENGKTPLDIAEENKNLEIANILEIASATF